MRSAWLTAADIAGAVADELLLAAGAFARHANHGAWVAVLSERIDQCSTALLPSIVLSAAFSADSQLYEALRDAAEDELCILARLLSAREHTVLYCVL